MLGGRLADLVGRRRLFIIGLSSSPRAHCSAGLPGRRTSLIAFRALQGLGGALLAPAALSLLVTTFAEGRERNLALGIYGAASGSGAAVGVLLGGLLTSYLSWSWIFFINVPVGIAAALLAPILLRESRPDLGHRHFDLMGAATVTGGLMLLVYALTRATSDGWGSAETLGLLGGAIATARRVHHRRAALAVAAASASDLPLADRGNGERRDGDHRRGRVLGVLPARALPAGRAPLQRGSERRAFSGFALSVVVVSNLAQLIVGRVGVRPTLTAGLLMSASSVALLTRLPLDGHYFWDMFPAFVLGGAGMGLSFVPVTIASLAGVNRADAGIASGLVNTSRQIGGAIGIAAATAVAAASSSHFGGAPAGSIASLDHGYRTALYAMTGLLVIGAALTGTLLRASAPAPVTELRASEPSQVSEAA